jgi:hypothetical protein
MLQPGDQNIPKDSKHSPGKDQGDSHNNLVDEFLKNIGGLIDKVSHANATGHEKAPNSATGKHWLETAKAGHDNHLPNIQFANEKHTASHPLMGRLLAKASEPHQESLLSQMGQVHNDFHSNFPRGALLNRLTDNHGNNHEGQFHQTANLDQHANFRHSALLHRLMTQQSQHHDGQIQHRDTSQPSINTRIAEGLGQYGLAAPINPESPDLYSNGGDGGRNNWLTSFIKNGANILAEQGMARPTNPNDSRLWSNQQDRVAYYPTAQSGEYNQVQNYYQRLPQFRSYVS